MVRVVLASPGGIEAQARTKQGELTPWEAAFDSAFEACRLAMISAQSGMGGGAKVHSEVLLLVRQPSLSVALAGAALLLRRLSLFFC